MPSAGQNEAVGQQCTRTAAAVAAGRQQQGAQCGVGPAVCRVLALSAAGATSLPHSAATQLCRQPAVSPSDCSRRHHVLVLVSCATITTTSPANERYAFGTSGAARGERWCQLTKRGSLLGDYIRRGGEVPSLIKSLPVLLPPPPAPSGCCYNCYYYYSHCCASRDRPRLPS
ncbi:uncharacterized protein [Penaeus vannamei]|uniref:uncharacterized protein n=1 Tax=Penaeus vannamei TaxID=6689 RepID=UPI00387F888D